MRSSGTSRVLVVSDVHGNIAALEAVAAAEPHDAVICLGDIVGYGPQPGACVRWVADHATVVVQGNHDRALARNVAPGCSSAFRWLAEAMAPIGRAQLTPGEIDWLGSLPQWAFLRLHGMTVMLIHATPCDPLYQYLTSDPIAWATQLAFMRVDLVLVGHTHIQFALDLGDKRVVNPGSVGQPKDGDPRAAYALIDKDGVHLRRADYSVERTIAALMASGAPRAVVEDLGSLLRTGRVPSRRALTEYLEP